MKSRTHFLNQKAKAALNNSSKTAFVYGLRAGENPGFLFIPDRLSVFVFRVGRGGLSVGIPVCAAVGRFGIFRGGTFFNNACGGV